MIELPMKHDRKATLKKLLLGVIALTTAAPLHAATPARQPNILFIISDDQGWNDYGFMGHKQIETPHLDRLAAESLTFTRGYTPVPLCRPSLATMVTGLYPHQHGVTGNDPKLPDHREPFRNERLNPKYQRYYGTIIGNFAKHPNFVRDLTARGYVALQTGKWWEGDPIKTAGFTHAMTVGNTPKDRHGGAGLEIGRQGIKPVTDFIESSAGKPWLVWYAPMLPHDPHTPPAHLLEKYLKLAPSESVARYWACVEWFDQTCGGLLRYLDERGLRDTTIILYACDNGYIPDPAKNNRFAPRSKKTPYEGGVRTPIMVSWPGKVKPRFDQEHLASTIDLWPTLAALLKTPTPAGLPGINLTSPDALAKRTAVFGEQYAHDIADVDRPTNSLENRWIIEGEWKLIVPDPRNRPDAKPELYHLKEDPWERKDLAGAEPGHVKRLSAQLDTWWTP